MDFPWFSDSNAEPFGIFSCHKLLSLLFCVFFFSIEQGHVKHGTWGVEATGDGSFAASGRSGTNLDEYSLVIFCPKENHENSTRRSFFFLWHRKWQSKKTNPKRLSDSVFYWSVRRIRYFLKEWFARGRRWMRPLFSLGEKIIEVALTEASISVFNGEEGSVLSRSCGYVLHRKKLLPLCVPVFNSLPVDL